MEATSCIWILGQFGSRVFYAFWFQGSSKVGWLHFFNPLFVVFRALFIVVLWNFLKRNACFQNLCLISWSKYGSRFAFYLVNGIFCKTYVCPAGPNLFLDLFCAFFLAFSIFTWKITTCLKYLGCPPAQACFCGIFCFTFCSFLHFTCQIAMFLQNSCSPGWFKYVFGLVLHFIAFFKSRCF